MHPPSAPAYVTPVDRIDLPVADGCLALWSAAFAADEADDLYAALLQEIDWRTEEVRVFGRARVVPRLVAWHGDTGTAYTYSGTSHEALPWTPALVAIRARVTALCGLAFNSVLLNRYRDGRDGMGWHADDEPELGRDPAIASVSLGHVRRFRLRHRRGSAPGLDLDLPHGSLLLMSGTLQHHWLHALPKTRCATGERINLTWRRIVAAR